MTGQNSFFMIPWLLSAIGVVAGGGSTDDIAVDDSSGSIGGYLCTKMPSISTYQCHWN